MRHRVYVFDRGGIALECGADTARRAWRVAYGLARLAARENMAVRVRVQCDGWLVYTLMATSSGVTLDDHRRISRWAQPLIAAAARCCVRLA
jgi:hypothetical protein